jgi:DNA-binding response OmpR family regulator
MNEISKPSIATEASDLASTIFVIDDDMFTLSLVRRTLQLTSYRVITVADAKSGIKLFRENRPDLVITDIMMPGTDGIETIRILREIDLRVPIIAMSGGGQMRFTQILNAAKALGANETICKPFQPAELLAVITRVLDRADGRKKSSP